MKIIQKKSNLVWIEFSKDLIVSTAWGAGTYSDNHDAMLMEDYDVGKLMEIFNKPMESSNCEVYFINCPEDLQESLEKKYNDGCEHPISYLDVENWIKLIMDCKKYVNKQIKTTQKQLTTKNL